MPTMAEYAASGGYAKDAQAARNVANMPTPSYSSGSSSSRRISTPTPPPAGSGGYMNVPIAGGGSGGGIPPMPSSYQSGDVTYTPGPANWGSMSQSQRDAYGSSLSGGNVPPPINNTDNGMLFPAKPNGRGPGGVVGVEGGWADGVLYEPLQTPQQGAGGIWSPQQGNKNYQVTADMGMGGKTPPPYSATQGSGNGAFPVKTPAEIAAEAKARTDALLAKQTTLAAQTKQGFNTSFDRLSALTKDDRTLQDAAFQQRSDPFNGMTGFQKDMTGRQREISDQQSKQDLQTRLANVDLTLADYTNANEAERMKMETDMTNAERAYGMQVDQYNLQRQGQAFNQGIAQAGVTGKYNGQDTMAQKQNNITNDHWQKSYDQGTTQWDKTFNAGRQDVAYNHGQDQITNNRNAANDTAANTGDYISPQTSATMQKIAANSAAWFNASPTERTRLAAENQSLGSSIGAKQDENGNWVAPQPQRTIAGRTLDQKNRQDHIALAEALTKAYGVNVYPTDDPAEAFKQVEGRVPIDMQQLEIAKQNAASLEEERKAMSVYRNAEARRQDSLTANSINTSNRAAANAAATHALAQAKFDYEKDPNNPDNIYKLAHAQKAVADANKADASGVKVDSKTSTNNYYDVINQLKSNKATKDNAGRYVDSIKDHLSDTDYKNLQKWVEDNTFNPKK